MANHHVIWKFEAPPGTRFVNEMGSGANLYFGPGMEMEVYQFLFVQLQDKLNNHLATEARMQAQAANNPKIPASHQGAPETPAALPQGVCAAPVTQHDTHKEENET